MSTGRSPITLMIDRACGFDPSNPPKPRILDEKAIGNAMLEVCDAAEAWKRNHKRGTKRLAAAVVAYQKLT